MRYFFLLLLSLAVPVKALEFSGDFIQGGLVFSQLPIGSQVFLDKQAVALDSEGYFALGFGRDAAANMTLKIISPDGKTALHQLNIQARDDYRIQKITGIDKKIMDPKPATLKRIRNEADQVRKARNQVIKREDYRQPFQWPLTGPITGVYGSQRVYNGRPGRPHYGVDIAAPTGTPITTPAKGVITLAHADMFYSGGTIIIDHGYGLSSSMLHLSKVLVKVGDEVSPGDIIGEVGAGGRATGPHLDWRMNWYGARVDPQRLVPDMASVLAKDKQQPAQQNKESKHD